MLKIAYGGTLSGYDPSNKVNYNYSGIKSLFKIYRNNFQLSISRSGYFLFKGVEILKKNHDVTKKDLQINLWGDIHITNKVQINELDINDLIFIDNMLPKSKSIDKLKSSDILFLPIELNAADHNTLFIPGKVFEYFMLQKPILILSQNSDCLDLVKKSGLGICANPENPNEIAELLLRFIRDKNLLKQYVPNKEFISSCSFKVKSREFAAVFDRLLKQKAIKSK